MHRAAQCSRTMHPNAGGCVSAQSKSGMLAALWVWGEKKGMCTCGLRSCCAAKGAGAPTQLRAPLLTVLMLMGTRRAPGSLSENPDLRTNCCTVALLMKLSGCFRAARVRCYVCYLQSQVTGRISCPAPVVDLHAEITQQSATNCKICHLQQCLQHCF